MPKPSHLVTPEYFTTFGELLRYLRERAEITQRELAIQVGYHYSYMSRLERNERFPDSAMILARFVPALHLEYELEWATRLVELATKGRGEDLPESISITQSVEIPLSSPEVEPFLVVPSSSPAPTPPRLPIPLTPLLGRRHEIQVIRHILLREDVRLLTLIGPPGVGKTRLALQTAVETTNNFEGVYFIDLAPVLNPDVFLPEIAKALDIQKTTDSLLESFAASLAGKRLLLVLDNFEQIVDAAFNLAALLQIAPGVKVLVTSRETLRLSGENEFAIAPLPIPDTHTLAELKENPAIQLFVQRAQAVQPTFQLTSENAPTLAEICSRLDGLPLALELAAARIKLFSPEAMLKRLDKRLNWLTGGKRDDHTWRQTLRGAIEWSYQLLSEEEKKLFISLAVFSGGGNLTAVEEVCDSDLDTLAALAEKSLIFIPPVVDPDEELRFSWLESLREFAREVLIQQSDLYRHMQAAHAFYFRSLAEQTHRSFIQSRSQHHLIRLDTEHDNLRAALAWAIENREGVLALSICVGLGDYWDIRGHFDEGRHWLRAALEIGDPGPSELLANALRSAGWLALRQNVYAEAIPYYRRSVETWQTLQDESAQANALMDLGLLVANESGRNKEGISYFQEALGIYRKLGDTRGIANALNQIGLNYYFESDFHTAHRFFEESLTQRRASGDKIAMTGSLNNLGLAAYAMGDYEKARQWHVEALAIREELGFEGRLGQSHNNLAMTLLHLGEINEAEAHARAALDVGIKLNLRMNIVEALESLGMIFTHRKEIEQAACLLGAVEHLRNEIGALRDFVQQQDFDTGIKILGELIHTDAWHKSWYEGTRLNLDEAANLATQSGR